MRAWLLLVLAACGGGDRDPLEVQTDSGGVRGVMQGETRAFLGVPYAAPPVGELRWRPPQRAAAWEGVRDAVQTGLQCPQSFSLGGPGGDEDCLFVNVWSPPDASGRPVLVWLHGGAFIFGSGGDSYYNGKHLAETYDVVVVTVNYRLGALGFLAHPAFAAEDPSYPSSGNWGLDDQLAALQWVQRNIEKFGGDKTRVTLFGESAGGFSTCVHYLSPRSAGLFHAAISESGLCSSMLTEPSKAAAEADGVATATSLGCTGTGAAAAACLRSKTADQLLAATAPPPILQQPHGGPFYGTGNFLATLPNVDGFVIAKPLRQLFAGGNFEARPLLLGANRDEGTIFHSSLFALEVTDEADYRAAITRRFGAGNVDAIVAQYPVASYASANRALAEVTGDAFFVCSARRSALGATAAGASVYAYSFQRELTNTFMQGLGVFHIAEVPFVFGTEGAFPLGRIGDAGQVVADAVQGYWTRFAASGDPNGVGATEWPTYTGGRHLVLDASVTAGMAYKAAACDFWDAVTVP